MIRSSIPSLPSFLPWYCAVRIIEAISNGTNPTVAAERETGPYVAEQIGKLFVDLGAEMATVKGLKEVQQWKARLGVKLQSASLPYRHPDNALPNWQSDHARATVERTQRGRTKITDKQRADVIRCLSKGMSIRSTARIVGISTFSVGKINKSLPEEPVDPVDRTRSTFCRKLPRSMAV